MKVSVIIPVYNEEKDIKNCLESLKDQSLDDFEIIVVDDGSVDNTPDVIENFQFSIFNFQLLRQNHRGAAQARNLGAKNAKGEILVFVDADMTFSKDFLENLIKPIIKKETIGTFSKEEFVLNKDNIWSKCWNINKNLPTNRMHPLTYPDTQPVFRAILKEEFDKVGGFDPIGYIDDHTLAAKLGVMAINAPGAVFYHKNPDSMWEVFQQARWIGKSEYKNRKIKNEFLMRLIAILRYSIIFSFIIGLYKAIKYRLIEFLLFKIIFDFAVEISLLKSFFNEQRYR